MTQRRGWERKAKLGEDGCGPCVPTVGDTSVSTQTGAFQYRYPIAVPPGRLGVEPTLALTYSSQGALYGGVAAGWSLDLPEIRPDWRQSPLDFLDDISTEYVSTMAGGQRLVPVDEPAGLDVDRTFRAQHDSSYARYEQLRTGPFTWRVRTHDGKTHYFGESDHTGGEVDSQRAVLTRTVDEFGNSVDYFWQPVHDGVFLIDHVLERIEYTSNSAAAPRAPCEGPHGL